MRGAVPCLLMTLWCVSGSATSLSPQDFASGMTIVVPRESSAYRVTIPLAVYQGTVREDLGDLRVFNAQGEAVPYSLSQFAPPAATSAPAQTLPLFPLHGSAHISINGMRLTIDSPGSAVNVQTQGSAASSTGVRQYILDARGLDAGISALQLAWSDTAEDYSGRLMLEVSEDLGTWSTVVAGAPITNLHANGQSLVANRIELGATRAKFWRLSWATPSPTFELSSVMAETADRPAVVYASLDAGGTRDAADGHAYTFDVGAHVPVSRVNLALPETNSLNRVEFSSRRTSTDTWHTRTIADVYRIATPDGERSNAPVTIHEVRDRYWRARILQGGDLVATPPHLVANYVPAEVTFLAQGHGPFVLAYGNVGALSAETDLSQISAKADVAAATVNATQILGGTSRRVAAPAPFPWMRAVLWCVLILAAFLLGWMAFRLSKEAGT
jgi:hypothetical protein